MPIQAGTGNAGFLYLYIGRHTNSWQIFGVQQVGPPHPQAHTNHCNRATAWSWLASQTNVLLRLDIGHYLQFRRPGDIV
jgi:hypothetical protein